MVFMADQTSMPMSNIPPGVLGRTPEGAELEPLTLIAALSQFTTHIGLAATASTTFHPPYQLARQFGSTDHMSGGRAAWNVVTSSRDEEARNFGSDTIMEKSERYERAREALAVAFGLWESWEPDAFPRNKDTGVFFDVAKMHPVRHMGKHFKVHGPLTMPPTPQVRPVIIQAGASDDGMDLAASMADVIYTVQSWMADAQAFYAAIRRRVEDHGRMADAVKVMPGVLPVIASSQQEADDLYGRMRRQIDPLIGLENLSPFFGDLSKFPLDGPVPALRTDRPVTSRGQKILDNARRHGWTIRHLLQSTAIGNAHHVVVGTPARIADIMEEWLRSGAADGFNILPAKSPGDVRTFVRLVVPELQSRGLFRTAYEFRTLRENLGLPSLSNHSISRHSSI